MAHRIAELMAASAKSKSDEDKDQIDQKIQTLIIDLWKHRTSLPGNVDPNKRLASTIKILSKLEDNQNYYVQQRREEDAVEGKALEAYHETERLIVQLALLKMVEEYREWDKDENRLPLTENEVEVRRKLEDLIESHVHRPIVFRSTNEDPESKSNIQLLEESVNSSVKSSIKAMTAVKELLGKESKQGSQQRSPRTKRSGRSKRTKL